ncbi:helix-turn-helix domain-containing protein [Thermaerobacillus caldiproteolyticus]|uniref:helix-turn-helix domain-containing protein n=1 Tax=Thermaerobacillus caldiproteolyticus TaxID=247480 RepID=UPI00188A6E6E|nr:XRE family transcriptional regulator [Anoxybacillus caldiproteolyticus]QPA31597.1 helix-turn-helix domain-containing protein [Anoxybacillus caldiproteolyticus]
MGYSFGKKLKSLRTSMNLTQEGLAKALNTKYGTNFNKGMISKWENDKEEPRIDSVRYIADFFNVSLDEILGLKDNEVNIYEVVENDFSNIVTLPIVGTIAAGQPILAAQNIEGYMPILSSFLNRHKEYFYLKVKGDSMNLEFPDGSYVLVERTSEVENGSIAVVLVNGHEATVKKVSINKNIITLIPMSNDPSYQPQIYDITRDEVKIIGKVIQAVKIY